MAASGRGTYRVVSTPTIDTDITTPRKARVDDPLTQRIKEKNLSIAGINEESAQLRLDRQKEAANTPPRGAGTQYKRLTQSRNRAATLDILNGIYGGDPVLQSFLTAIKHTR